MLDSINPLLHPGFEHLNQTSPQGRLCSMLGRLSPRPCTACALNWRHHPEKDKDEGEKGKARGRGGEKGMAEMGGIFFCFTLCGNSQFGVKRTSHQIYIDFINSSFLKNMEATLPKFAVKVKIWATVAFHWRRLPVQTCQRSASGLNPPSRAPLSTLEHFQTIPLKPGLSAAHYAV